MNLRLILIPYILTGASPLVNAEDTLRFRTHLLNAESEFPACAVFDVNRDGRADVFSGGWWYSAPAWERHFVRDVEKIGGRFDDYANLPVDVNADGWIDVVSVNYRSRSLYWVENPRGDNKIWKKHEIDVPGPAETGRLEDVDGDGRLDILPNGVKFAAWYELLPIGATTNGRVDWRRHDLPAEASGHGLGFGDVDGDGRSDLVTASGWLRAPEDRNNGRWIHHPEFKLHRDASIPILVYDVDGDGDCDIVYGRGHNVGLYWVEQKFLDGARSWIRHAIDTSWSQAHALLRADLDNDGQKEVIAGKRYLGHDGRDPGEWDPLGIYCYSFDKTQRTWRRAVVDDSGNVGFDLDPKVADVDGDGDMDVVAPSRAGLYWCENLTIDVGTGNVSVAGSAIEAKDYDPRDLSYYLDSTGKRCEVRTPSDWGRRRVDILRNMEKVMGTFPDPSQRVPLEWNVDSEEPTAHYLRRKITFAVEPGDRVPAWLLIPNDLRAPTAAMLCLHQTTSIGKDEPVAIGGRDSLWLAHELANRGFVCLVPDYPSFGEYQYDFQTQGGQYDSGSMKAIWNNVRALDLLESLPEVDPDRIGCIGHSLGGHNCLFTAAFDQRLRAVVTSCGFTAFHHYYGGDLKGWTSDRYMPRIREVYENSPDRVPFDFYEVLAALAPRGLFVCAPLHDDNFDNEGVQKVVKHVQAIYDVHAADGRLIAKYPDVGHDFPLAEREQAYSWLEMMLK
jgi:dienelactone hydrolase